MDRLLFRTGAATLTLKHLANAGFERMSFEGGVSSYTLDFGGKLQRDARVDVKTGLSDLTLVVPADTAAQIIVRQNITAINVDGKFAHRGDSYYTPAWDKNAGPKLIVEIVVGVGNINLRASSAEGAEA